MSSANSQLSLGGYTTVAANGLTTYTSVGGLKANYYQGASGGVTYTGMSLQNSMAISTATAQSAAVSFVQSSFGMPSDAVLVDTLSKFTRESNGSRILTGYEFVWNHAGGSILGGDAIKVDVEDDHYISASYCDKWMSTSYKPICLKWTYTYADRPNISYGYRLWKSLGAAGLAPNFMPLENVAFGFE